jgi:hypothetical protein
MEFNCATLTIATRRKAKCHDPSTEAKFVNVQKAAATGPKGQRKGQTWQRSPSSVSRKDWKLVWYFLLPQSEATLFIYSQLAPISDDNNQEFAGDDDEVEEEGLVFAEERVHGRPVIKGGNIEKLVERLTFHKYNGEHFKSIRLAHIHTSIDKSYFCRR